MLQFTCSFSPSLAVGSSSKSVLNAAHRMLDTFARLRRLEPISGGCARWMAIRMIRREDFVLL
jgi:hypothetical protein